MKMIPQLCLSWLSMNLSRTEAADGTPTMPVLPLDKPSLVCLQQKGQALGWAAAQPELRKALDIPDQPSGASPCHGLSLPAGTGAVCPRISPFRLRPVGAVPPASDGQGHQQGHILLSSTQGHCPPHMLMDWEVSWDTRPLIVPGSAFACPSLSAGPSVTPVTSQT